MGVGHRTLVSCPSCGLDPGEGRFCRSCGTQLDPDGAAAPDALTAPDPTWRLPLRNRLLVAMAVLAIVATTMALIATRRDAASDEIAPLSETPVNEVADPAWSTAAMQVQDWQLQIGSISASPDAIVASSFAAVTALDPEGGGLLWQRRLGPGWNGVEVVGDLAVFQEVRPSGSVELRAVDVSSGTTRWVRRDLVEPLPISAGSEVVLVRAQTARGGEGLPVLHRLDPATGGTLWDVPVSGDLVGAAVAGDVVVTQTLLSDEDAGEERRLRVDLRAHSLSDGATRWTLATDPVATEGDAPGSRFRGSAAVAPVAAGPETLIASDPAGRVIAVDATTGRERWRDPGPREGAPLAVVGDLALYGVRGGDLRAVEVATGDIRWETPAVGVRDATRILGDETGIAVFHVGSRATILDARDGTELARSTTELRSTAAAFHEGRLVIGSFAGDVTALEPSTGEIRWTTAVLPHVSAWLASAPGRVLVTVPDRTLVAAFDAGSGELAWRRRLLGWGVSAPIPDGSERVLVRNAIDGDGAGTSTVALDVDDGDTAWSSTIRDRSGWGAWLEPPALTPSVVIFESGGVLRGIDRVTGQIRWARAIGGPDNEVRVIAGGEPLAFVATADGTVVAIEPSRGRIAWQVRLPSPALWITSSGDTAIVAGEDATVRAVDGEVRWEVQLTRIASQPPLVNGSTVVVTDGRLLGISRAGGRVRWELPIRQPLAGPPTSDGERVAVATTDGSIHVVAAATGRTIRQHLVSERVLAGPVTCATSLCVLTVDGHLRAVD